MTDGCFEAKGLQHCGHSISLSPRRCNPAPSLETFVRFLFAAITLAAAGVGFVYLDQSAASSLTTEQTALRPLFDWAAPVDPAARHLSGADAEFSSLDGQAAAARDAVRQVQAQSRTVLNDFVRDHGIADLSLDEALHLAQSSLNPTAAVGSSNDRDRDELTSAAPPGSNNGSAAQLESASSQSRTPGASVQTATVVRGGKPNTTASNNAASNDVASDIAASSSAASVNEIAQIAGKGENVPVARTKAVATSTGSVPEWKVIGKTTEGRPLHTRRFGDSGSRTLIVAGLDGEDRIAVRWIDELADELARRPELYSSSEVLIFRAGNPDGLTHQVAENARGVLINRNFPSRRYRPLPDMSSGSGPATEAETRALLDTLYTFHPRRVIHLAATSANTKAYYNRSTRETANDLQRGSGLDVQPIDIEKYPGSLEDFADGTLEAGVLSIQLSAGNDWRRAWSKHLPMVLSAVTGRSLDKHDPTAQSQDELTRSAPAPAATRTPIPVSNSEPARHKKARGYEELPAPPQ